jgi:hypothetical protein
MKTNSTLRRTFWIANAWKEVVADYRMRALIMPLVLVCFGCTEGPDPKEKSLLAEVERRVVLPKGAGELRCYKRYYAIVRGKQLEELLMSDANDLPFREILIGLYRRPGREEEPGIQWVENPEDMPKFYDGGCNTLRVSHAAGLFEKKIKATCSFTISGNIPDKFQGQLPIC